jgi:NADH-quinone oxidoreductase subunit A
MTWALAVYGAAVTMLAAGVLIFSHLLGEHHKGRTTGEAYESGIRVTESARLKIDVKFYLVAMLFVIFDMESVFVFAWAVSCRQAGWAGYLCVVVFTVILAAALFYLWRSRALDWGTQRHLKLRNGK